MQAFPSSPHLEKRSLSPRPRAEAPVAGSFLLAPGAKEHRCSRMLGCPNSPPRKCRRWGGPACTSEHPSPTGRRGLRCPPRGADLEFVACTPCPSVSSMLDAPETVTRKPSLANRSHSQSRIRVLPSPHRSVPAHRGGTRHPLGAGSGESVGGQGPCLNLRGVFLANRLA